VSALAPTLQAFFTDRLIRERDASPQTIASYRDTWRLLVGFAAGRSKRPASSLDIDDLDASAVVAFLNHLETERHNGVRTRNVRLAAIRSFLLRGLRHPEHAETIARVLAIAPKRFDRAIVTFLAEEEADALIAAPDVGTWTGRRDRTLLLVALQCGLRISELVGLGCDDIHLGAGAHVACRGKGRKERVTPLTRSTAAPLRTWLEERGGAADDPLFPTSTGRALSRDAVEQPTGPLRRTGRADLPEPGEQTRHCPRAPTQLCHATSRSRRRHHRDRTLAWTRARRDDRHYLHAEFGIKGRALERTRPPSAKPGRYQPSDSLLTFLESL
jgi:integrase/recombinase XerD